MSRLTGYNQNAKNMLNESVNMVKQADRERLAKANEDYHAKQRLIEPLLDDAQQSLTEILKRRKWVTDTAKKLGMPRWQLVEDMRYKATEKPHIIINTWKKIEANEI